MKKALPVGLLLIVICLAIGCSGRSVETGNPSTTPIAEGAYLITTADGSRYTFELSGGGNAIVKSLDGDNNVLEEKTADLIVDEDNNSFTATVIFSDGTKVVISGYINSAENILNITVSINDITVSFSVCLSTSDFSDVITIKPCSAVAVTESSGDDDVYWVSSIEGLDTNSGSIDNPFKTIAKALEVSQDGTYKDIHVVGGDYTETVLGIASGIGIYGGYGELTAAGTRERDVENNKTNVQMDRCGFYVSELNYGDLVTVDGLYVTAPGMVFCVYDASINISNNEIHATLSDEDYIDAVLISSSKTGVTLYANIEDNIIIVDDIWVQSINTMAKGITFVTSGSGASASLNLKDNEITVGNGRGDSWGIIVSQQDAASAYFVATDNIIQTGSAGRNSSPILLSSLSSEGEYAVGGSAIIERNTLIAGDIDQSVKSEYQEFGADTAGIQAWGFGEASHVMNNMIVSGETGDYSYGISLGYGNNFMVYNNTIVARETTGVSASKALFLYKDSTIQAVNNIICADSGYGIYKHAEATILSLTSNLFCDGINSLVVGYEGESYFTYDAIADLLGTSYADDSNLTGDPKFVDEANLNFHLSADSVAIDAGEDLTGIINDDIDGQSRPNGSAFDIGADEYY